MKLYDYLIQFKVDEFISRLYGIYDTIKNQIDLCDEIIKRLSKPDYATKWFKSDYHFWDMHDYILTNIKDCDKYYKERRFDEIVKIMILVKEKNILGYTKLKEIIDSKIDDFETGRFYMSGKIERPPHLENKIIKREGKYDKVKIETKPIECLITFHEYLLILNDMKTEDSKYSIELMRPFMEEIKKYDVEDFEIKLNY